jgi:hypothetical protein
MTALCRFEILLPLQFNDGILVPRELLAQTVTELEGRFGAATWETQILHGSWKHEDTVYHDELVRIFVDTQDTPANRAFFRQFKEKLKTRFQQLDIWLTVHPIEVL